MNLQRTLEQYANCTASGVVGGSKAQMMYFVEDAKKDIATLAEDRDRIERNRDMWKGQVERQAQELEAMRAALRSADHALACVTAFEADAREIMGNTNFEIVKHIREKVRAALPAPSSTTGEAA